MKKMAVYVIVGIVVVGIGTAAYFFVPFSKIGLLMSKKETAAAKPAVSADVAPAAPAASAVPIEPADIEKLRKLFDKGDEDACVEFANELLNRQGNTAIVLGTLGDVSLRRQEYYKAAECYDKALQQEPNNPWFLRALGRASLGMNKLEPAVEYFNKAIEHDKTAEKNETAFAYFGLSLVSERVGDTGKALEYIKKAMAIQPDRKMFTETFDRLKMRASNPAAGR